MPGFLYEKMAFDRGFRTIAGLDEAGRGALFGPVVAAAVVFSEKLFKKRPQGWIDSVDDSKLIAAKKRKILFKSILMHAESLGCGLVTSREIDKKNIHWASLEAMKRAVDKLCIAPDFLLVDGFRLNNVNYSQESIYQGDRKSISIAAASIVAKVMRDEMMVRLDQVFEGYALAKHKGYGTKKHYEALKKYGPTTLHRRTFNLKGGSWR